MRKFVVEVSLELNEDLGGGKFQSLILTKDMNFYTVPHKGEHIALTPLGSLNWAKVTHVVHNPIEDDVVAAAMVWCSLPRSNTIGAENNIEPTVLVSELGWQYV